MTAGATRLWGLLLLGLAALGCAKAREQGAVEGVVTWEGRPVPSAMVGAYPKPEQDASTAPVAEAASGADGSFRLTPPEGRYWVWARATVRADGRDLRLVGQARPGPSDVRAGARLRVRVELKDPSGFAAAAGPAGTGVSGRAEGLGDGKAFVYAYPGRLDRPLGPGFVAAKALAADGSFRIDLRPGPYTLAVRERGTGSDSGVLAAGDRVASASAEVAEGRYADVGTLRLRPLDPARLRSTRQGSPPSATRASGTVTDADGKPLADVRVLAFRDARMAGKPLAVSAPTAADGRFTVYLPGGGTYYLGARSRVGGPSEPGERVGAYRGEDGGGLRLAAGQVRQNLVIPVEEVW